MLTNEAPKLQALYQTVRAEELLRQQRVRELAVRGVRDIDKLPPVELPDNRTPAQKSASENKR